ncbi:MAG TPA: glycoside hydrolase family 99-like domain-containing protein [Phycisphaerae bacterium]|nr:glycoside hydrolase family 99-like domain-containing protein [Phycisphaerae bacterium]HRW54859.1 glycoside hydrolase family 99-like domain-containing protein [Phycisphaerae bacterium]
MTISARDRIRDYSSSPARRCSSGVVALATLCLLAADTLSAAAGPKPRPAPDDYTIAAYYFPNYHVDARNEKRLGKGWTEWELIKKATPHFEGHQQPKVPLWGYTDEADPREMARKIDAAADHGVDVFIFDWYYYNDGPFLQRGLDEGFLGAKNNDRIKFALMWANHDWVDLFPARANGRRDLLYPGAVTPETWDRITDLVIEKYFKHPSYWTIDGKPYFSIYELNTFMKCFGGAEGARAALDRFREKAVAAGLPGVHVNGVVYGVQVLPSETAVRNPQQLVRFLGLDSVTSYVWVHHIRVGFPTQPYKTAQDHYNGNYRNNARSFGVPYYPNVTMGWDATPRTEQGVAPFVDRGYPYMGVFTGNTPEAFRVALEGGKILADESLPEGQRIITINSWNEWTEGSYLEPDTLNKLGYLEAIKAVFGSARR